MPTNAWLIPLLPFLAFVAHVCVGRRLREGAAAFGIVALGVAFALSVWNLVAVLGGATAALSVPWLRIGAVEIPMGFRVGPLEAVMLFMVTLVSWMVEVFSVGYMHGDRRYNRFFAIVNLFVFGMLTLVVADNFLLFLFAWEVMGLCSYLLIGHWFEDLENAKAALKAFLTTRLGDVGMMVGIWLLFAQVGTLNFAAIDEKAAGIPQATLTAIALLLFLGAVGKSAQVPLHIWLPDAMAGPTPVSALIHAATMVAAGVFLVARSFPLFAHAPAAAYTVAVVGAVTSLVAALVATVQVDIKKTLAYSTISQLGYMMLGLGVGGYAAGLFHLNTHAFFKALLFLGSGSVIHAVETQDMHRMGGLFRKMPLTGATFVVGTLALAGIPPFAGFFSKDEILLEAYHSVPWLFWLGVVTVGLTAYYMTRAVILTFLGRPRDEHRHEHAHESPAVMTLPLVVLAVPAVLAGLLGSAVTGHWFQRFVAGEAFEAVAPSGLVQGLAIGLAVAGIAVAWLVYGAGVVQRAEMIRMLRPLYVLFKQKFYFDHAAAGVSYLTLGVASFVGFFDRWVIDGLVNGAGWLARTLGAGTRRLSVGSAQAYALTFFAAVVVGMIVLQVVGG